MCKMSSEVREIWDLVLAPPLICVWPLTGNSEPQLPPLLKQTMPTSSVTVKVIEANAWKCILHSTWYTIGPQ